jgi:folate-binding protein YgfZ
VENWLEARMITLKGFAVKDFLQGYLTCDSARINNSLPTPMALCTLKGRVLANGWALELAEGVGLVVHRSLAEDVITFLKPYAMFAKCAFHSVDTPVNVEACEDSGRNFVAGWAIANRQDSIPEQNDISQTLSELMAEHGRVFIDKTLSQKFLPQMLDLHVNGAVDFDKGCYLGQEIVARAQFRGAVKKQLAQFQWQGSAPVVGGTWQNPEGVKGDVIYVSTLRPETAQQSARKESASTSGYGLWVTRKTEDASD